jgi:hypothetical protein
MGRSKIVRRALVTSVAATGIAVGQWLHSAPAGGDDSHISSAPAAADISALLSQVRVVDHLDEVDGYERGCGTDKKTRTKQRCVFGPAWNDPLDHSGCDTRSRLLSESLHNVTFKPGTRNCKPAAGVLSPDPYTGADIDLKDVEVDHVYAISRAWNAGAWRWSPKQRQIFANDLTELIAVSRSANRAKSDAGLDEWLPSHQPCTYAQRYLAVAAKYELPITVGDRAAAITACR